MHLIHSTLIQPSLPTQIITGQFTQPIQSKTGQEIVILYGQCVLKIYKFSKNTEKLIHLQTQECFGIFQQIKTLRFPGQKRDYILCTSDSGKLSILIWNTKENRFVELYGEIYGKQGLRRIVPGLFMASDPKGRAFMICACEKQKFVYILNREEISEDQKPRAGIDEGAFKLTISSPLEGISIVEVIIAHKSNHFVQDCIGLEVGYENPMFCCLEVSHEGEKFCVFYELDLGLNHVVRKYSEPVDESVYMLIPLPSSSTNTSNTSGILSISPKQIQHINPSATTTSSLTTTTSNPTTTSNSNTNRYTYTLQSNNAQISTYFVHPLKDTVFLLLGDENGVLYTVDYTINECGVMINLDVRMYEDLSGLTSMSDAGGETEGQTEGEGVTEVGAGGAVMTGVISALTGVSKAGKRAVEMICVLKSGYILSSLSSQDLILYRIESLQKSTTNNNTPCLEIVDQLQKIAPITCMSVNDPTPHNPMGLKVFSGGRSFLMDSCVGVERVLSSPFPGVITDIYTITSTNTSNTTSNINTTSSNNNEVNEETGKEVVQYIVLSGTNENLTLKVDEEGEIEECVIEGWEYRDRVMYCEKYGNNGNGGNGVGGVLQVTSREVRMIHSDGGSVDVYSPFTQSTTSTRDSTSDTTTTRDNTTEEGLITIANGNLYNQIYLVLNHNTLVYLSKIDRYSKYEEVCRMSLGVGEISAVGVLSGVYCEYLMVGLRDQTLRVLRLERGSGSSKGVSGFESVGMQVLNSVPVSICIHNPALHSLHTKGSVGDSESRVYVGLENGVLISSRLDIKTWSILDSEGMYLGPVGVYLTQVGDLVLARSSRTFIVSGGGAGVVSAGVGVVGGNGVGSSSGVRMLDIPKRIESLAPFPLSTSNTEDPDSSTATESEICFCCLSEGQFHIYTLNRGDLHSSSTISGGFRRRVGELYQGYIRYCQMYQGMSYVLERGLGCEGGLIRLCSTTNTTTTTTNTTTTTGEVGTGQESTTTTKEESSSKKVLVKYPNGENILHFLICTFHAYPGYSYLIVSVHSLTSTSGGGGGGGMYYLDTYYLPSLSTSDDTSGNDNESTVFIHRTSIPSACHILNPFQGRLLLGTGNILRLYDLGKSKLLLKTELQLPHCKQIIQLETMGNRLYIGDLRNGLVVGEYLFKEGRFVVYCFEAGQRYLTRVRVLDYDTVGVGDKFGMVSILRIPRVLREGLSEELGRERILSQASSSSAGGGGTIEKYYFEELMNYYVGPDLITYLNLHPLQPGADPVLLYATLSGRIGYFKPVSKGKYEEMYGGMEEVKGLGGREVKMYRSMYRPIKCCLDGDYFGAYGGVSGSRE